MSGPEIRFREPAVPDLVSCVVPAFNAERFLSAAIESVLAQDGPRVEVIVIDDGSTDGTRAVAASFGVTVRLLEQANAGPAAARNRGLEETSGAWIAFLDADDLWLPGKLAAQVDLLDRRPEVDLCVCHVQNVVEDESGGSAALEGHRFEDPVPGYYLPCLVARRSAFERVGGFDPGLRRASDNDWFLRARDAGLRDALLPDVLVRRRLHEANLTRDDLASRDWLLRNLKASLDRRRHV